MEISDFIVKDGNYFWSVTYSFLDYILQFLVERKMQIWEYIFHIVIILIGIQSEKWQI